MGSSSVRVPVLTVAVVVVVVDVRGRSYTGAGVPAGDETLLDVADAGPAV